MTGVADELSRLAAELEVGISPSGEPDRPLVFLPLDRWLDAPAEFFASAAGLVAGALPITVGLLSGPPSPRLEPLLAAATLTLSAGPVASSARSVVPVGDVGAGDGGAGDGGAGDGGAGDGGAGDGGAGDGGAGDRLEDAAARLRACVERSPRAALACGQLLRQTPLLPTTPGLAAEAAAYSLLLGGPEFARWLAERGAPRDRRGPEHPVRVSRDGARLTIVLDDPGRRNAFSARLREALLEAVQLAEADETISDVRISGAGAAFCSGGDLDEFGAATDLVAAYLVRLDRAPWRVIDRIAPKVTVHAHGACIGAGIEITAFAGRVIAAPDSFFALPEVRMGLVPGAGGSVSVPRRIGRWRAAWLMLTGDRIGAGVALRWGLVDEVLAGKET